jgi:hypothetical protein
MQPSPQKRTSPHDQGVHDVDVATIKKPRETSATSARSVDSGVAVEEEGGSPPSLTVSPPSANDHDGRGNLLSLFTHVPTSLFIPVSTHLLANARTLEVAYHLDTRAQRSTTDLSTAKSLSTLRRMLTPVWVASNHETPT